MPNTVALVARRAQEELRQSHCHGRLPQSISAEGLIQLSRSRRAKKETEEAAAEAKREAKAANKGDREQFTCKLPGCSTHEHSSKEGSEILLYGATIATSWEFADLCGERGPSRASRAHLPFEANDLESRGRKAAREQ